MKDSNSDELRKQYLKTQGLTENEINIRVKREGLSNQNLRELERLEESKAYLRSTQPKDIKNFASNRSDLTFSLYHKEKHQIAMKKLNARYEKILQQIKNPQVNIEDSVQINNSNTGNLSEREILAQQFKNAKRYKLG